MSELARVPAADWARPLFGVVIEPRTYLGILYLLLAFPLGVGYFVFLVTGFALGLGLAIIWVGIPILFLMILAVYGLTSLERQLAIHLLDESVPPLREVAPEETAWQWLKGVLSTPATWKGLVFLLLKFPLGVFSFVLTVTLSAVSVALIFAPVILVTGGDIDFWYWRIDTLPEAYLCSLMGLFLGFLSLHIFNAVTWVWGALSRFMLGHSSESSLPESPVRPPSD